LDFSNIYTLYSIYFGLALGFLLKFIFVWSVKQPSIDLLTKRLEITLTNTDVRIQRKNRMLPNPLLIWISKFVRNKSGTGDEQEGTMIFLLP
jgi:hypothetical protein